MTGYVNNADFLAAGQGKPREAEVNGHLAFLLFFKAVGVNAGQGGDERGFAVVDVAGSADNTHGASHNCRGATKRETVPRRNYQVLMIRS